MVIQLWTEWWFWLSFAAVLGILEVLIPAFVFLGFALGAAGVGILLATGWLALSASWSFVIFAVLSLVGYVAMRAVFGGHLGQIKRIDHDINDN